MPWVPIDADDLAADDQVADDQVAGDQVAGDLASGAVRGIEVAGTALVLWRTGSGVLVACEDRCPHQWSALSIEGVVVGEELVCTAHGWRFDCAGGGTKLNVRGRRDVKAPVATFPLRRGADGLEVELPE